MPARFWGKGIHNIIYYNNIIIVRIFIVIFRIFPSEHVFELLIETKVRDVNK